MRLTVSTLALAIACTPVAGIAATTETAPGAADQGPAADEHHAEDEEIIVTGVRRRAEDVLGGVTVLDAGDLTREVRSSIGETLARQPGVSATSFGPTASAPVVRGLTGERVRVLTDGIGTLDLSGSDPDHAIAINPVTADRIEVLRGPAALLFGSSAIGGVVNVIDSRIPRRIPDATSAFVGQGTLGSAAGERSAVGALDVRVADKVVLHLDGSWSRSEDLRTGGPILSADLREAAQASADPEIQALADLDGRLPNSAAHGREGAAGLAWIGESLNLGISVTRRLQTYEVPVRYSLDPGAEVEKPTIDVRQTRFDARAEVPIGGAISQLRMRGGLSRYRHNEIEEDGAIGSTFASRGGEGRIELVQADRAGWAGTSGAQYLDRSVSVDGEEKYLPDARQAQAGLFTVQTLVRGKLRFEAGARVEYSKLSADADSFLGTPAHVRRFTTMSGSLGGQYEVALGWRAGLSLSSSARAPSVNELFAFGPHGGSQTFEIGDPALDPERSLGVEATVHRSGPVHVTANLFYSRFSNFIFKAPTGEVEDDLPVYEARQGRADYAGFEVDVSGKLGKAMGIDWGGEVQADYVRATIRGFGPAPLLPPLRMIGALTGSRGQLDGRVELERAFAHNRVPANDTRTPGYTLVNLSLDWHPSGAKPELTLSLAANNIFDVEARRSTSLLKDYAPLAGRDLRLTARLAL